MFKLFRKKSHNEQLSIWKKYFDAVDRKQRQAADFLQKRTDNTPIRKQKIALILFIAVSGVLVVFSVYRSFQNTGQNSMVTPIRVPTSVFRQHSRIPEPDSEMQAMLSRITAFKDYMDSLKEQSSGRKLYDSIILARPGLMDSISTIQQLYQLNNNGNRNK